MKNETLQKAKELEEEISNRRKFIRKYERSLVMDPNKKYKFALRVDYEDGRENIRDYTSGKELQEWMQEKLKDAMEAFVRKYNQEISKLVKALDDLQDE